MALRDDTCQVKTMDETQWEKEKPKKKKKTSYSRVPTYVPYLRYPTQVRLG
jgi:hypothetical protein